MQQSVTNPFVYAVQDATKGVAAVFNNPRDARTAAKYIKSTHPRQHYRVYRFPLQVGVDPEFYDNELVYDTRDEK